MTKEKKTVKLNKDTNKVVDDKAKGENIKTLRNVSVGMQDKVRVEFTVGPYAGTIEDVPEMKAERLIKMKKARTAKGKDLKVVYNEPKKAGEAPEKKD